MAVDCRQCILMRHAHAEWPAYLGRDFDRPLNPYGEQQAQAAAQAMLAAGFRPTRILASAARRTRQTAELVAASLDLPGADIDFAAELYNSSPVTLEAALRNARATDLLLLIAHNPGIATLARQLSPAPDAAAFAPAHWCVVSLPGQTEPG